MVTLKHYNYLDFPLLNYTLDDMQSKFTATVGQAVKRLEQRNLKGDFSAKPISIFYKNIPAGFFILDFGIDKLELTAIQNSVLLRSLSINPKFQGMGIGKGVMNLVPEFVGKYFPETANIVLAVDETNTVAAALYEKCGFSLSTKRRTGSIGIQKIMFKNL